MTEAVRVTVNNDAPPAPVAGDTSPAPAPEPKLPSEGHVPDPNRPAWLPEKFKSAEDLAKAYGELESQFTKSKQSAPETPVTPQAVQQEMQAKGVDFQKYSQEYTSTGALSKESRAELAKAGIDGATIDTYVAGVQAHVTQTRESVFKSLGLDDTSFGSMIQWAQSNMSQQDLNAYNAALGKTSSPEEASLVVAGLKSRYEAAQGTEAARVVGGNKTSDAGDKYESKEQIIQDMKDPRYAKDPAYRSKVEAKVKRSTVI